MAATMTVYGRETVQGVEFTIYMRGGLGLPTWYAKAPSGITAASGSDFSVRLDVRDPSKHWTGCDCGLHPVRGR